MLQGEELMRARCAEEQSCEAEENTRDRSGGCGHDNNKKKETKQTKSEYNLFP